MKNCKLNPSIQGYVDLVESGRVNTCLEQKLLIKYVNRVFETEDLFVDDERVEKYLSYQKYFPFELFDWEKFVFVLHNCVFMQDGNPRWSDLLILIGRGGGKNGYLAFEDFSLLTPTNGIREYDIDICANSEDQAKTTFKDIYNILENPKNPDMARVLRKNFKWNKTEITNIKTGSTLKFRTNNPKGKDGLRSGKVDFDEPHAYENWDNINVFTTGLGKKPHPRRTYITTNGDVRDAVLDQLIEKSLKILNGEMDDNGFLPFICKLDSEDEVYDEGNWEKANPSLPFLPTLRSQMRREYSDYLLDPIKNSAFMTKRMNIPQGRKDTEVTSWENILSTNKPLPNLMGKDCTLGIDYAKTTDFVSAILLFRDLDKYYAIHHSWFCTACVDKHRIKAPIKEWAGKGLVTIVDDVEINPKLVADWVQDMKLYYNITYAAIDSYRYTLMSEELGKLGFSKDNKNLRLVRPSDKQFVQPLIDSLFIRHNIIWGNDPVMRWFTNNTKLIPVKNGNFDYDKIEPKTRKNDGFMAFVAAMTVSGELPETVEFTVMETLIF